MKKKILTVYLLIAVFVNLVFPVQVGSKIFACVFLTRNPKNNTYSIETSSNSYPTPLPNQIKTACGWYKSDTLNVTGWAELEIHTDTDPTAQNSEKAYGAGYLEGFLSFNEIYQIIINDIGGKLPYSPKLSNWVDKNTEYIHQQVSSNPNVPFWYQVGLTFSQFDGLYDGYAAAAPANMLFDKSILYAVNLVGDLADLCPAFGCTVKKGMSTCHSKEECDNQSPGEIFQKKLVMEANELSNGKSYPIAARHGDGHCSILVKPIGKLSSPSDIIFGHTTWTSFGVMGPRIMKLYDFAFQQSKDDTSIVPGKIIAFSGYPSVLYSNDDWYTISSGLTVSETTIENNNESLWSSVRPECVLTWSRTIVANRLATSGKEWTDLISFQNSGTYNNAWQIVDWKTWSPGLPIPDNFLWQVELMPGLSFPVDLSSILRSTGYWASYNRIYNPYLFNITNQWDLVLQFGDHFTWDKTSRAVIFLHEVDTVTDLNSFSKLLRYNKFQTDPISAQGCTGGAHSASNAISERGDLTPNVGCEGVSGMVTQQNEAGIDAKYTSYMTHRSGKLPYLRMYAQASPTYDSQPVFIWSKSPFAHLAHIGQSDRWEYPWVDFDTQWD